MKEWNKSISIHGTPPHLRPDRTPVGRELEQTMRLSYPVTAEVTVVLVVHVLIWLVVSCILYVYVFFYFLSLFGEMNQFDYYFSDGLLKPPTSYFSSKDSFLKMPGNCQQSSNVQAMD